jgi:hypothetical protein
VARMALQSHAGTLDSDHVRIILDRHGL